MNANKWTKTFRTLALSAAVASLLAACGKQDATDQTPAASSGQASAQAEGQALEPVLAAPKEEGFSEYQCTRPVDCNSNVLGASTREEATWLRANGYPSQAELKNLRQLSDSQLKAAADAGSVAALAVYGERLAMGDDTAGGLDALRTAADRNSIYAYYGLARVYAERKGLKNLVESGAYLRVAYMLGDSKAATTLQAGFPTLHPVENAAIDRRAASLYQTFAKNKAPRPRPT